MMKTTTRSFLPLLIVPVFMNAAKAQDWTVGVPVDMLLYTQTFYGGCTPNADYTYTFPNSPVSGVDYIVKITDIQPGGGTLDILPGLDNGGLYDALLFDAAVQRTMTLAAGTTSAVLEFRAQGTPAQEGQAHPCTASQFWISNLMFCPEGLIPNVSSGCTVQTGATAISEATEQPRFQWPSPMNGQQLSIALPSFETARLTVFDATGRSIISRSIGHAGALDLSMLSDGAYLLDVVRSNGTAITKRFLIARQ